MEVPIQWLADSFQNDCQEWDLNPRPNSWTRTRINHALS